MKNLKTILMLGAILTLVSAPAWGYDAYKSVPDVDKPDRDGDGNWPDLGDMSCWQACAANLLAGAGWGLTTNTAQQNADAIYGQMNTHFGTGNCGKAEIAINWWLYNYGYNPDDVGGWYQPTKTYNDVTIVQKNLAAGDYDHLLNELNRCQYVAVSWEFVEDLGGGNIVGFNHCLTLVGGNKSPTGAPNNVSIWHDSDRDVGGADDNVYTNTFDAFWHINYTNMPPVNNMAQGYVTLCPGEQKPASAMENYDAAYYRDYDAVGNQVKTWRIAGKADYGQPAWVMDGNDEYTILQVENEEIPEMYKMVYLLIDFRSQGYNADNAPDIDLMDDEGKTYDAEITVSADGGQIKYEWTMDDQPPFERIIFPSLDYYYLSGDVKDFNIATECVPEPFTLTMLVVGSVGLILRRKRRI